MDAKTLVLGHVTVARGINSELQKQPALP